MTTATKVWIGFAAIVVASLITTFGPRLCASDPERTEEHREIREGQRELRGGQESLQRHQEGIQRSIDELKEEMRRLSQRDPDKTDPSKLTDRYGAEWSLAYIAPGGSVIGPSGPGVQRSAFQLQASIRETSEKTILTIHWLTGTFGRAKVAIIGSSVEVPAGSTVIPIPQTPLTFRLIARGPQGAILGALTPADSVAPPA